MTGPDKSKKRKIDSNDDGELVKKLKVTFADSSSVGVIPGSTPVGGSPGPIALSAAIVEVSDSNPEKGAHAQEKGKAKAVEPPPEEEEGPGAGPSKPTRRIKKLVPPRPFPTVPTSVSATGPRSAHKEGKNFICLTRKTPLGAYMRRCKNVILTDGYKTLHLSAMGAAIPHLLQLTLALPPILPFAPEEIHTEILTGTVEVQDEIIPDDEDEDISYRTRGKSTLKVVIKIGNGEYDGDRTGSAKRRGKNGSRNRGARGGSGTEGKGKGKGKSAEDQPKQMIFQEPEQDGMDVT